MKLFSIIVPTYNRGYILPNTIKSVLNQNFSNWELIIVDDGSTDNTPQVVKSFLTDDRISYIRLSKNRGVNYARNIGISKAKGKYIVPLDSDNQLLENALEIIYQEFEKIQHPLIFFRIKTLSGKKLYEPFEGFLNFKNFLCEKVKGEFFPVVERELLLKFPYEENLNGGEGITWKKIVKYLGKIYFSPKEVLLYNDLLEDRLSNRKKNLKRIKKVFLRDLKTWWKYYLKFCPILFFSKALKIVFYQIEEFTFRT